MLEMPSWNIGLGARGKRGAWTAEGVDGWPYWGGYPSCIGICWRCASWPVSIVSTWRYEPTGCLKITRCVYPSQFRFDLMQLLQVGRSSPHLIRLFRQAGPSQFELAILRNSRAYSNIQSLFSSLTA
jgi:hypothetical protein